jgi:hypothetical protein
MTEYVRNTDSYISCRAVQVSKDKHQPGTPAFLRIGTPIPGVIGSPCLLIFKEITSGVDKVDREDNINHYVEQCCREMIGPRKQIEDRTCKRRQNLQTRSQNQYVPNILN